MSKETHLRPHSLVVTWRATSAQHLGPARSGLQGSSTIFEIKSRSRLCVTQGSAWRHMQELHELGRTRHRRHPPLQALQPPRSHPGGLEPLPGLNKTFAAVLHHPCSGTKPLSLVVRSLDALPLWSQRSRSRDAGIARMPPASSVAQMRLSPHTNRPCSAKSGRHVVEMVRRDCKYPYRGTVCLALLDSCGLSELDRASIRGLVLRRDNPTRTLTGMSRKITPRANLGSPGRGKAPSHARVRCVQVPARQDVPVLPQKTCSPSRLPPLLSRTPKEEIEGACGAAAGSAGVANSLQRHPLTYTSHLQRAICCWACSVARDQSRRVRLCIFRARPALCRRSSRLLLHKIAEKDKPEENASLIRGVTRARAASSFVLSRLPPAVALRPPRQHLLTTMSSEATAIS